MSDSQVIDLQRLGVLPWQRDEFARLNKAASSNTLAHAYLIGGMPGTGKRAFAHGLVASRLCQQREASGDACGRCEACLLLASGSHPDLLWLAPEQAGRDIKIDQVRQLADFMSRSSHAGSGKFAVIEAADRLNVAAANALLKTLEEPTPNSHLLLISDLPGSLMPTLRSRCQRLSLPNPEVNQSVAWLSQLGLEAKLAESLAGRLAELKLSEEGQAQLFKPLQLLAQLQDGEAGTANELALGDALLRLWRAGPRAAAALLRSELSTLAKAGPSDELVWIGYLQATSAIVIKYGLTRGIPSEADSRQRALCEMAPVDERASLDFARRLLRFQQQLQAARREQLSAANPNPQMLFESLLWSWSQLQGAGS